MVDSASYLREKRDELEKLRDKNNFSSENLQIQVLIGIEQKPNFILITMENTDEVTSIVKEWEENNNNLEKTFEKTMTKNDEFKISEYELKK